LALPAPVLPVAEPRNGAIPGGPIAGGASGRTGFSAGQQLRRCCVPGGGQRFPEFSKSICKLAERPGNGLPESGFWVQSRVFAAEATPWRDRTIANTHWSAFDWQATRTNPAPKPSWSIWPNPGWGWPSKRRETAVSSSSPKCHLPCSSLRHP